MAKQEQHFSAVGKAYKLRSAQEYVKRGQDFVWYGEDNLFPQHTNDLYEHSATHNALVNSISSWIYGGGLDATNKEKHPEDFARFQKLITKKIGKNDVQLMCMDVKLHGGFYISLSYSLDRTQVTEINVLPYETMRSGEANEDGDVDFFYYSQNWQDGRRAKIERLKSFQPDAKATYPTQVLFVKMNSVGSYYYPKPDYIGAWNYIELDKNVAQFHLSQIENGLAPSYIMNFSNGIPTKEKRDQIKREIEAELSGSDNAGKFLCTFSDGKDTTPEITPVPLSDADKQYQFLSEEITKKVMISHRVVSPRLFGVMDGGGLGNNAEELQTASALFEQVVINPFRDLILDALHMVLAESGMNLKLKFESFNPFETEFTDTEEEVIQEEIVDDVVPQEEVVQEVDVEQKEASYNGAQISSAIDIIAKVQEGILTEAQAIVFLIQFLQLPESVAKGFFSDTPEQSFAKLSGAKKKDDRPFLSDEDGALLLDQLEQFGEVNDDEEWELLSEEFIDTTKDGFHQFNILPTSGMADADDKSKWGDVGLYKVRYVYQKTSDKTPTYSSRPFCEKMMQMTNSKIEWRYEDIIEMSEMGVNGALSQRGDSTYNLFLYQGGVNCYHGWMRRIYFRKSVGGKFLPNKGMDNEKRVGNNPYVQQKGSESIAPIDTPSKGRVNPI